MDSRLYCLPLGKSRRDEWVEAVRGDEQALLLLPTSFLLHKARELAGNELASRLLSFDELAEKLALNYQSFTPIDRLAQEMIVEEVLAELQAAGRLVYFKDIAGFPGYISTVTSLISEIRRTGTTPDEFSSLCEARDFPEKDGEVYAICQAYQEKLTTLKLADLEETYFIAAAAMDAGRQLPYEHIYISEFYIFTPLQRALIRRLRTQATVHIGIAYERDKPEVYQAVEVTYGDLVGMGFKPIFDLDRVATADICQAIACPDRKRELRVVAGKIKQLLLTGNCELADIAIVARDTAAYRDFYSIMGEYGIPIDMPMEERLIDQPLARLVADVFMAAHDHGAKKSVLAVMKAPYISHRYGFNPQWLEMVLLDKLIAGWEDWEPALADLSDDADKCLAAHTGFCAVRALLQSLPQQAQCCKFVAWVALFLQELAVAETLAGDYRHGLPLLAVKAGLLTYKQLQASLERLEKDYDLSGRRDKIISTSDFWRDFSRLLQEMITIVNRDSQGIKLISPQNARGLQFAVVFIVGLTDGEFPLRKRENWLYKDRERRLLNDLGLDISTVVQERQLEDFYFHIAMALAADRIFLSCYEDEQTMPSAYFLETTASAGIERQHISLSSSLFSEDVQQIYSRTELIYSLLAVYRQQPGSKQLLREWLPEDFWCREAAEQQRQAGLSRFNGYLSKATLARMEIAKQRYSISSLEDYASCPFRFLATRLWRLNGFAEQEDDVGNDVIGNIYHAALAGFLRKHRGQRLSAAMLENYKAEMGMILEKVFAGAEAAATLPGSLWLFEKADIVRRLYAWLKFEVHEQETAQDAFLPAYLEWSFGLPKDRGNCDEASIADPLVIELSDGHQRRIIGKIDRIDKAAEQVLRIFDYKKRHCRATSELLAGQDLQIPLYIWAVKQYFAAGTEHVAGGGYYSIEALKKSGGIWFKQAKDKESAADLSGMPAAQLQALVKQGDEAAFDILVHKYLDRYIIDGIEAGDFSVRPQNCSAYCLAADICRYDMFNAGCEEDGDE